MAGKREQKRADLKQKLLMATIARIERDGLVAVRARDLAKDAGCALGAIYNIFEDMDELVFHAKVEVFRTLEAQIAERMADTGTRNPLEQMQMLSNNYFTFASENVNLWTALFAGDLTERRDAPDWYYAALKRLMGLIAAPLSELNPDQSDEDLKLQTRTLFSAIHGITSLTIQQRPSGVAHDEVEKAMNWLLKSISK